MKLIINKPKSDLPEEGIVTAVVKTAGAKKNDNDKVALEFAVQHGDGHAVVSKEYSASLDMDSLLFKDVNTIMGSAFGTKVGGEFELGDLVGKKAQVVVQHRTIAGGRLQAVVAVVLDSEQLKQHCTQALLIDGGVKLPPAPKAQAEPVAA